MRKSFIFYRSFYDAVKTLPIKIQAEIYNAIADYALNGNQPTDISPIALSIFTIIQPQIDANTRRYENGCKGGAPHGNKNAKKTNQKQPKITKNNQTSTNKQPKTTKPQPNDNNILLSNSNELSNNNYSKKDDELNKFIINNINGGSDDVDDVAKVFFEKISNTHFVRHATKALSISAEVFLQNAKIIIAEWKLLGLINFLPENTPEKHLINQMRIKRDLPAEIKAQAGVKERQNKITENKIKEEQIQRESTELRGSAALAAFRQSKGLSEKENIISMIGVTSEAEAIRDVRTIIAQS